MSSPFAEKLNVDDVGASEVGVEVEVDVEVDVDADVYVDILFLLLVVYI